MAILHARFPKNTEDMVANAVVEEIITAEFSKSKTQERCGQGIDMLVPILLEMGTEEQKQSY